MTSNNRIDVSSLDADNHPIFERSTSTEQDSCSLQGFIVLIPSTLQLHNYTMSSAAMIENESPVEFSSITAPAPNINGYMSVKVTDERWHARLQDKGCEKTKIIKIHISSLRCLLSVQTIILDD